MSVVVFGGSFVCYLFIKCLSAKVTISFHKKDLFFRRTKPFRKKKPFFDGHFPFRKKDLFFRRKNLMRLNNEYGVINSI
jgi:hypothetical protein